MEPLKLPWGGEITPPVLPQDPREAFHNLLVFRLTELNLLTLTEAADAWQSKFWADAYEKLKQGKKLTKAQIKRHVGYDALHTHLAVRDLDPNWHNGAQEQFTKTYEEVAALWYSMKNEVEQQLMELADQVTPSPGETWHQFRVVNSSDYRSVDCGSGTYAKNAALRKMAEVQAQGIEAEIRVSWYKDRYPNDPHWAHSDLRDFEVWVKTEDVNLLRYRSGMTLKQFIQWCGKHGVNPRVYDPFLPHGIEEKLGLDHFGNELPA